VPQHLRQHHGREPVVEKLRLRAFELIVLEENLAQVRQATYVQLSNPVVAYRTARFNSSSTSDFVMGASITWNPRALFESTPTSQNALEKLFRASALAFYARCSESVFDMNVSPTTDCTRCAVCNIPDAVVGVAPRRRCAAEVPMLVVYIRILTSHRRR